MAENESDILWMQGKINLEHEMKWGPEILAPLDLHA